MKRWISWPCHDCDAEEGQIHKRGCDMERCPSCGGQLISCGCYKDYDDLPFRIPYLLKPSLCALCGRQWPTTFKVPNKEWKKYVIPPLQDEVLCQECYDELKKMFPEGWKK